MSDPITDAINRLRADVDSLLERELPRFTAWATWTPTVTQSGAVTISIAHARYMVTDKLAIVSAWIDVTGPGTIANAIVIGGLPVAPADSGELRMIGNGSVSDSGTGIYQATVRAFSATTAQLLGTSGYIGAAPSFALANGDDIQLMLVYEIA